MPTPEPEIIRSSLFSTYGLHAVFTTRQGGISVAPGNSFNFAISAFNPPSHVKANMQRLIDTIPLPCAPKRIQQVHGCKVSRCTLSSMDDVEADALITSEKDLPLSVQTADCLPVLLADPVHGLIAAIHAGWRGTTKGIVARTVQAMCEAGASPPDMLASLGPCIGPCCFVIDRTCAVELSRESIHQPYVTCHNHCWTADLAAMNRARLIQQGLQPQHIECLNQCTSCHPDRFFSYRRDHGNTGRHLAVVVRPSST